MIAKRINNQKTDHYSRLANYIVAAKDPGEKLHSFWIKNCIGGDDLAALDFALAEIETTQGLNTTVKNSKTYHLMVSFMANDKIPSIEQLKDIEEIFTNNLGFQDHQRVAGCHQNTEHFHIHIAYNKINPKTLNSHSPFQDFVALKAACDEVVKKYDLNIYETKEKTDKKTNQNAQDFERKRWEQSFDSFVRENKKDIIKGQKNAKNWSEFHLALANYGIAIKPQGAGFVLENFNTKKKRKKHQIKASSLDRTLSKKSLENRFGAFEPLDQTNLPQDFKPKTEYQEKPLLYHKDQDRLWRKYQEQKKRQRRNSFTATTGNIYKNWRDFIFGLDTLNDPFAKSLINFYSDVFKGMKKGVNYARNNKTKRSI